MLLPGGSLVAGRFRVEGRLGVGGSATVYRVLDTRLGVVRALKVLEVVAPAASQQLRRRLHGEAQAMARLDHPHVLQVFDVSVDNDPAYVVMELAEGGSLGQVLDRGGPLAVGRAARVMVDVLDALHAAHELGIVHRDVKPQNLLLGRDDRVLLADFGIALLAEPGLRGTRSGVAMGSMAFMAPEQRLDAQKVDRRADIYAAGATLYNLATGANPVDLFTAGAGSPRLAGLPPALREIILRATRHAPGDRFPSAVEMRDALDRWLETPESRAPPLEGPAESGSEPPHPLTWSLTGAGVLGGAAGRTRLAAAPGPLGRAGMVGGGLLLGLLVFAGLRRAEPVDPSLLRAPAPAEPTIPGPAAGGAEPASLSTGELWEGQSPPPAAGGSSPGDRLGAAPAAGPPPLSPGPAREAPEARALARLEPAPPAGVAPVAPAAWREAPAEAKTGPLGEWVVNWNLREAPMWLWSEGEGVVHGQVILPLPAGDSAVDLRGTWDEAGYRLLLDARAPTGVDGKLELSWSPQADRLEGQLVHVVGVRKPVTARRP